MTLKINKLNFSRQFVDFMAENIVLRADGSLGIVTTSGHFFVCYFNKMFDVQGLYPHKFVLALSAAILLICLF